MKKALGWLVAPLLTLAVVAIGLAAAVVLNVIQIPSLLGSTSETTDSRIQEAVERQAEVALLALRIQGLERVDVEGTVLGIPNPFGNRTTLVQYSLTAKIGVDGEQVDIEPAGTGDYLVHVPGFIFIGNEDPRVEGAFTSDGAFSILTPEIDQDEIANRIFSTERGEQLIEQNLDESKEQTEVFYRGIIAAIDPSLDVRFEFEP